jgi:hypothetical protein
LTLVYHDHRIPATRNEFLFVSRLYNLQVELAQLLRLRF